MLKKILEDDIDLLKELERRIREIRQDRESTLRKIVNKESLEN